MKVSVSLPEEDIEFLDGYAKTQGMDSRSAVMHKAVRLLRASELGAAYEDAWKDWVQQGDDEAWAVTTTDGLT
ncbi:MAG TPA: ribbon-helix-helix domain-containing protein [Acidimicrobiales bacterium]|jgi:Arc/MetJ-type ribon-helix-helix transcriptional regulator|nr:ribbon-helix-helix domain-containing protein [Acidimicrobiales bacterium]